MTSSQDNLDEEITQPIAALPDPDVASDGQTARTREMAALPDPADGPSARQFRGGEASEATIPMSALPDPATVDDDAVLESTRQMRALPDLERPPE